VCVCVYVCVYVYVYVCVCVCVCVYEKQVFHLFMFHLVTGMHVWEAAEVVVEFGGGYGALTYADVC
jgi:hypothetical protein